jgi:1,4-dihydroxy-2-naphthoate octaprenyltransferase
MNAYVKALRAPFLAGSLVPVTIGAALAFRQGTFLLTHYVITSVGVGALHLGSNLLNDYHDARGSDPINVRLTPFSGGSRAIQEGNAKPGTILIMTMIFFAIALGTGCWLTYLGRPLSLLIGFLGLGAAWAYSAPPLQLMSRGWGEVVIFFAFGPLITLGTYYVMSGSLSWAAFALGFPQGFLIAAVIWINQFPDFQSDLKVGKKNLVVRLGPSFSRALYGGIMISAFMIVIFLISIVGLSYLTLLSFMAFPLAYKAMRILWQKYRSYQDIIPAQALTIQTVMAHGLLLSLGLILSRISGL